jgi:hypothetical protein
LVGVSERIRQSRKGPREMTGVRESTEESNRAPRWLLHQLKLWLQVVGKAGWERIPPAVLPAARGITGMDIIESTGWTQAHEGYQILVFPNRRTAESSNSNVTPSLSALSTPISLTRGVRVH